MPPPLPKLPPRAAYLLIDNPARRNALSLATLRSLKSQLTRHLTSPVTGELLLLPPFQPSLLPELESAAAAAAADPSSSSKSTNPLRWLVDTDGWLACRAGLPSVIVLRPSDPSGPVFSSGHDLRELAALSASSSSAAAAHGSDGVRETFALCAEVMALVRRSPAPVVAVVDGLATAAGLQLALSADVAVASARAALQLPGARLGLPCTSPAAAAVRRLPPALAQRLLYTGEVVSASEAAASGALEVVRQDEDDPAAFPRRVAALVEDLAVRQAAQPRALAKWAFWTQMGMRDGGGDGYPEAAVWAGRVMALHAATADAKEGMNAFLERRTPVWKT